MKQAKIAIIVVCLLVGGFLVFKTITSGPRTLDNASRVINIVTGEIKVMDRDEMMVIPYPDAEGRRVILPAVRNDENNWSVAERFRASIPKIMDDENLSEADLAIDLASFSIKK
ncbi:MAG: hypothetical protein ACIAQF_02810 [Phycisphaerales bacterium JB065]